MAQINPLEVILGAVNGAVRSVANNPLTDLKPADAPAVAAEVKTAIAADPMVQHVTNTEPWYQSRVFLGALATIASGIGTEITLLAAHNYDVPLHTAGITAIAGALFTIYGRFLARAPLGS